MDSLLKETKTVFETLSISEQIEYQKKKKILSSYIKELTKLELSGRLVTDNLDSLVFNIFYKVKEASK